MSSGKQNYFFEGVWKSKTLEKTLHIHLKKPTVHFTECSSSLYLGHHHIF